MFKRQGGGGGSRYCDTPDGISRECYLMKLDDVENIDPLRDAEHRLWPGVEIVHFYHLGIA